MKCPHCLVEFHDQVRISPLGSDSNGKWYIKSYVCANPSCRKRIFFLANGDHTSMGDFMETRPPDVQYLIYPKGSTRPPVPHVVTKDVANDYTEACLVLLDSPKASAALSRRCLQNVLLEKAGVRKGDLSNQIQQVIDSKQLPSHLSDDIDAIRNIGNFAAHPNKSLTTGAILEVEPHEAEWNLEVLESLFDFYYVQPEKARLKREALNVKLAESGKPPMK